MDYFFVLYNLQRCPMDLRTTCDYGTSHGMGDLKFIISKSSVFQKPCNFRVVDYRPFSFVFLSIRKANPAVGTLLADDYKIYRLTIQFPNKMCKTWLNLGVSEEYQRRLCYPFGDKAFFFWVSTVRDCRWPCQPYRAGMRELWWVFS
jgi:hypothetical protein